MSFNKDLTGTQYVDVTVPATGTDRLGREVALGAVNAVVVTGADLVSATLNPNGDNDKVVRFAALRNPGGDGSVPESAQVELHIDGDPGPDVFDLIEAGLITVKSANAAVVNVTVGDATEQ